MGGGGGGWRRRGPQKRATSYREKEADTCLEVAVQSGLDPLTVSTNGLLWPSIVKLIQQKLERSTPTPEDFSSFFCVGGIEQ